MSWLSEVEELCEHGNRYHPSVTIVVRMARVIRELMAERRVMKKLCIAAEEFANGYIDRTQFVATINVNKDELMKLPLPSPDVKELL